jgi:hypothetical protein
LAAAIATSLEKANAAEPPKSKAVTKAPVTASKAGNNAHPAADIRPQPVGPAIDL